MYSRYEMLKRYGRNRERYELIKPDSVVQKTTDSDESECKENNQH
jgi:hypothetical protein